MQRLTFSVLPLSIKKSAKFVETQCDMNTATIRQRLHSYLETADEKKVLAIYTMVEDEINQQNDYKLSEEQIDFLDKERVRQLEESSPSYNWDEAKKIIRSKSSH